MNNIKNKFSIKDLETFSGIKAHTIRIWEKRYALLTPSRTETNIRFYTLSELQKLLNISYLNTNGIKISKIGKLDTNEINEQVLEIQATQNKEDYYINTFKMAMLNFDQTLFYNTYNTLAEKHSFRSIFYNIFIPLLEQIGILWQTNTITPAHEHFISELIKQKILIKTHEAVDVIKKQKKDSIYVCFLPENEIHEIGLLFLNYEISANGLRNLYLGQSVPISSLEHLNEFYDNIIFISSFTVKPESEEINTYLTTFHDSILKNTSNKLYVFGRHSETIEALKINSKIKSYPSLKETINALIQ